MAERRMFAKTIIDSDTFLDMPLSTQALYFHLSMRADDDGFINNPKKIQRMIGASEDDLKLLIAKNFIIPFESGVVVIKHWKIHNYIQRDRYKETIYTEEKAQLVAEENRTYALMDTSCIQAVSDSDTQVRIDKDRDSIGEKSKEIEESTAPPAALPAHAPGCSEKSARKKYGQYGWVKLTDEEYNRLLNDLGQAEVERCIAYIDESAQSTGNKNKWRDWNLVVRRCHRDGWGLGKAAGKSDARVKTAADYADGDDFVSGWNLPGVTAL